MKFRFEYTKTTLALKSLDSSCTTVNFLFYLFYVDVFKISHEFRSIEAHC